MRHLLDIVDLSVEEIHELISISLDIMNNPDSYREKCKYKKLATLFFEPSTRTRLSFETAMLDLGGSVVGFESGSNSSAVKGETIRDTVKVVGGYVDIISMRHFSEGAAFAAANVSEVPIINAGDGGHAHPTQTLADILTIYKELGGLENLKIGFCGDLLYGRTVHSLINAMIRYKNNSFVFLSPDELSIPDYVKESLDENGIKYEFAQSFDEIMPSLDVLYMTRIQKERLENPDIYESVAGKYILNAKMLRNAKETLRILHPLPRVDEIAVDVDSDKRAAYFAQTYYGKIMRMALIIKLLNKNNGLSVQNHAYEKTELVCQNKKCITRTERDHAKLFYVCADGKKRCAYCESKL